jgi:HK97 family phage major capsid protein
MMRVGTVEGGKMVYRDMSHQEFFNGLNLTCHAGDSGFQTTLPAAMKPQLALPVNGVAPDAAIERQQVSVNLRTRTPKNFTDLREAWAVSNWMKAVVSREFHHTIDTAAEDVCKRYGLQITNAGTEGTGSAGGFLVPAPLERALIDIRERVGVMPGLVRNMPMTSDTLTINKRSSGLTVYYGTENPASDMTASDKAWQQVELVAKKRYVVHQISQELVDDALIAVVDDAISEMGYALASQMDNEIINGTGSSSYGGVNGLLNSIGSAGVYAPSNGTGKSVWSGLTITEFVETMAKLPEEYADNAVWVCSRAFYVGVMLRLMAAAGGNTVAAVQGGDGGVRRFLDSPVYITGKMPKTTATSQKSCLYGDFSRACILGDRMGIRVARSDDFAFLRDLTTLKATARYDFKIHAAGNSSDAGGYVALSTAAS